MGRQRLPLLTLIIIIFYMVFSGFWILSKGTDEHNLWQTVLFLVAFSIFFAFLAWGVKLLIVFLSEIKLPQCFKQFIDNEDN